MDCVIAGALRRRLFFRSALGSARMAYVAAGTRVSARVKLGEHFPDRLQRRGEGKAFSREFMAGIGDQAVDFVVGSG